MDLVSFKFEEIYCNSEIIIDSDYCLALYRLQPLTGTNDNSTDVYTVYPKKCAHGSCFAVLCCGYVLTDLPISIRLTSLALWQSNDCPSASKATLANMGKCIMCIHYEWLHDHNKAKHNKTVCKFLWIYCMSQQNWMHQHKVSVERKVP